MSRTPQLVSIKRRSRRGNGATRAVKRDVSVIDWRLWMLRLLSASLIIALLMVTASVIHQVRSVEIGDVMITGYSADAGMSSSGASEDQLRALIAEQLKTGFWQLNLQQLKVQLESHPWVRQAMIRREWPNRLVIGIDRKAVEEYRKTLIPIVFSGIVLPIAVMLIAALFFTLLILKRLERVNQAMNRVLCGEKSVKIPVSKQDDEFDILAIHLNFMIGDSLRYLV